MANEGRPGGPICALCGAPFMTVGPMTIEGQGGGLFVAHVDCVENELEHAKQTGEPPRFRVVGSLHAAS